MAAALPEPTPAELGLARRMFRDGKSLADVHAALRWTCSLEGTRRRLKRRSLLLPGRSLAHAGADTTTNADLRRAQRARERAAAERVSP